MDSRPKPPVFSGLNRREQRVLVFLIAMIGAGLAWQHYSGGARRRPLVLHRSAGIPGREPGNMGIPGREPGARDPRPNSGEPLDLNTAMAEQLEQLPQIGPVKAKMIVADREARGPFARIEDLTRIPGIGEGTVEGLRAYVKPIDAATSPTAGGRDRPEVALTPPVRPAPTATPEPTRVNINTAGEEELCTLKGIGSVLAGRIVEYRRKHGPFRSPNDLRQVRGIGPVILRDNAARIVADLPR